MAFIPMLVSLVFLTSCDGDVTSFSGSRKVGYVAKERDSSDSWVAIEVTPEAPQNLDVVPAPLSSSTSESLTIELDPIPTPNPTTLPSPTVDPLLTPNPTLVPSPTENPPPYENPLNDNIAPEQTPKVDIEGLSFKLMALPFSMEIFLANGEAAPASRVEIAAPLFNPMTQELVSDSRWRLADVFVASGTWGIESNVGFKPEPSYPSVFYQYPPLKSTVLPVSSVPARGVNISILTRELPSSVDYSFVLDWNIETVHFSGGDGDQIQSGTNLLAKLIFDFEGPEKYRFVGYSPTKAKFGIGEKVGKQTVWLSELALQDVNNGRFTLLRQGDRAEAQFDAKMDGGPVRTVKLTQTLKRLGTPSRFAFATEVYGDEGAVVNFDSLAVTAP